MLKNLTQFKSVINGIETFFHFDQACPIEVAKQAILECLKWVGQVEDNIKAAQEAAKAAETPAEASKEEEKPAETIV